MKKAEMEEHQRCYHEQLARARVAQKLGDFAAAVELARSSWEHIDGMMRYERKYESREFGGVEGIDLVLQYAPLIFDKKSLDALGVLLKERRAIERNIEDQLSEDILAGNIVDGTAVSVSGIKDGLKFDITDPVPQPKKSGATDKKEKSEEASSSDGTPG